MSAADCIAEVTAAAGRALSDEELDEIFTELERLVKERRKLNSGEDFDTAVRAAADDYAKEAAAAAVIEKRNAAINLKVRLQALDFITTSFPKENPGQGVQALLVGINNPVKGARDSIGAGQNMLSEFYLRGFFSAVQQDNLWKEFVSGAFDRDIARVLWATQRETPLPTSAPKEAVQIAKRVAEWQDKARLDGNDAGAYIKKREGYIGRQTHNPYKVRRDYKTWRDAILPKLDADETFGDADPEKFLAAAWKGLASGIHLKHHEGPPTGFKGPRNIAKKVSAERVLHFKDADAWFDYNQQFGMGSLRETLIRSFEMSAQSTGLMRGLGTNPEANLKQITDELTARISDPVKQERFASRVRGRYRNQFLEVDGSTRMPGSAMAASVSAGVRDVQSMAKLGGALMSQFGDIPAYAGEMHYQGKGGYLSGIANALGSLVKNVPVGQRRELGSMIGVMTDSMSGTVASRFSTQDDIPGRMSRAMRLFFKYNGMTWWTEGLVRGAEKTMAHGLGFNADKAWGALSPDLQRVLGLYGIGDTQWNVISKAATTEADGRLYVLPETIDTLPDELFADFLKADGIKVTPRRIAVARREISDQVRTYVVDRGSFAVIAPDQLTRSRMLLGTQPGTVLGESLRFVGQFKSFSFAFGQKTIGREIYGRGANSLGEALKNGNGEMLGLAQLILWTTAFGYISMSAKDLVKGKEPRTPETVGEWRATILAAMVQGGGAGIYGDYLFGEVNRFGQNAITSAAGPTAGTAADLVDIWQRLRDGDDAAAKTLRTVYNNTPFLNLFYTRVVLDYLILNRMQELANPGALRRMEKRIKKETGQEFLLRPSQYAGS